MNNHTLTFALAAAASMPLMADITLTDADLAGAYSTKGTGTRVVCHDPSVFMDTINHSKDNPRYYIYGSHLGRGYTDATSNYQSWTSFKAGEESGGTANSLFANTNGTLVNYKDAYTTHAVKQVRNKDGQLVTFGNYDAHGWQYNGNKVQGMQWAPDVIWNPTMQRWLMYMSLNGDNWCSSIVCFAADSPEGPWIYQGPVVFSGFAGKWTHNSYSATDDYKHTDLELAIGTQTSLPQRYKPSGTYGDYWPNCIDPCVFYDHQGRLWMSYGSWSGGIFIIELDETNGLRDYTVQYPYQVKDETVTPGAASKDCTSDPYFGRKIAGGYYNSGEASYIERIGDYYYLFMSYGGLSGYGDYWATGYQMRVFRSEQPDGPYTDCLTTSGRSARFTSAFTNFGNNAAADYGVRIMSCYKWDTMNYAEIAQGHNSAIVDHEGRAMVVYHTRQNNNTEGHSVRVHQLFQNQNGWLVAAPYEYGGEPYNQHDIATRQLYTADQVAGDYQFIFHRYRQNAASQEHELPATATLLADGTVTGEYTGTWSLVPGTSYIDVTLRGTRTGNADVTFHGVLTQQTIDYTDITALCITALSDDNGTAAGSGATNQQTRGLCVWGSKAETKAAIKYTADKLSLPSTTSTNLTLPTGKLGTTVTWQTSNPGVLTNTGKIVANGAAALTAKISKDGYCYSKTFVITVDGEAASLYIPEAGTEACNCGWWTSFSDDYTVEMGKSVEFKFYNYTSGVDNWDNWVIVFTDGKNSHGQGGKEYLVLRADAFGWGDRYSAGTMTHDYNWGTFKADMQGALIDVNVTYANNKITMEALTTTQAGKQYHYTFTTNVSDTDKKLGIFFTTEQGYLCSTGPNGESLGIEEVIMDDECQSSRAEIYDIFGHRQESLRPGLNIVGGRKVIVR